MSKKNKDNNQFDISRKLKKLVEDLLSIAEEHHKNSKKGQKFFEKIEKHPKKKPSQKELKDITEFFEILKKNKNANHAFLIYSFSLFEQFLSGLLKHLIKTDEEIKKRYVGAWDRLLNSGDINKYPIKMENLRDDEWILENYDILLRHEKKTLPRFISTLLGTSTNVEKKDSERYIAKYNLYREVRNLLAHRGNHFDKSFFDDVKNNRIIKDNPDVLKLFLRINLKEKQTDEKDLIDEPVFFLLTDAIQSLLFYASWFSIFAFKKEREKDVLTFYGSITHDIMLFAKEHESPMSTIPRILFEIYKEEVFNGNLKEMEDGDKFNYFLSLHTELSLLRKKIKNGKKLIKQSKERLEKFNEDDFNLRYLTKNHINLLKFYIFNKKREFLEEFKNFDKNLEINKGWKKWFIFKRWMSDLE